MQRPWPSPAVTVIGHEAPAQAVSSLTTRQLQQDLWGLLYCSGPIDGVNGSGTRAAVQAFQKDDCLGQGPRVPEGTRHPDGWTGRAADREGHAHHPGTQLHPQAPAGGSSVGGTISRTEGLARARYWTDRRVPYSMSRYAGDPHGRQYRTDCSGFVSMAWHLSSSLSTVTLPDVSHRIGKSELRPGDILLKGGPGSAGAAGHVVLFRGWADAGHTSYYASEESGSHAAIARTVPYPYFSGYGTFLPYRYDRIGG